MDRDRLWEKNGYIFRLAKEDDAEEYYANNFNPLAPEIVRLTGSKAGFTKEEVVTFFNQCLKADNRYDFVIVSPDGHIIGESVINEIDKNVNSANFRIAIFHPEECGKGIGAWAIRHTIAFAFEEIKLHRLELDVFSFNTRAIRAYEKAGFKQEGVLKDAIKDRDRYADDILMAILEDEWRKLNLFEHIVKELQLGAITVQPRRVTGGYMHKMYRLETTKGKYAVKLLNPAIMKRPDALANYQRAERLERVLQENNIPVVPALEIDGRKMQCVDDQYSQETVELGRKF